ncbi:adenylate/guanylate cyclase domain-containing protein [Lacihabitans lacunae]|uniref:Adenylate/guanylate cyclase domain-containing protein n=1 Tax=Lacihabitans lacunae TaxID=1028214 RepID=A0ABV7YY50_9BACT
MLIFILFIFLDSQIGVGQQEKKEFKKNDKTSDSADSLYKIAVSNYKNGDLKKALLNFEKSHKLYNQLLAFRKIGECNENMGLLNFDLGDFDKAEYYFVNALAAYKKENYKKGESGILNNFGALSYSVGKYSQAIEYYLKALKVQEEIKNEILSATIISNIGGIYSKLKDFNNAIIYYNRASVIYKKLNDKKGVAKILLENGYIFMKQKKSSEALSNFKQALAIAEKEDDRLLEIEILSNLGEYYFTESNYEKALFYYNRCLKFAEEQNSLQYKSSARISIGTVLIKQNKYKEAEEKCKLGYKYALQLKAIAIQEEACKCLYQSYKFMGETQLALEYHEKISSLNDSLKIEETSNKMMTMEFQKQQLVDSLSFVKKQHLAELKHKEEVQRKEKQRNYIIATLCLMMLVAGGLWSSLNFVRKSRAALKIEKDRSEELLLNILPEEIAEELKEKGSVNTQEHNLVSILFTDFKSFTQTAANMTPQSLVEEINVCFKAFDLIVEKYQIEKIKTIGDAYMAAGGLPHPFEHSFRNVLLAGLEMQDFITIRVAENKQNNIPAFEMRLGIHAGPIVAGIVGVKKFQYDVWGDTVNTASRMESNCEVGRVNISETLYDIVKDYPEFDFEYRGEIAAKGKGEVKMYFVNLKTQT